MKTSQLRNSILCVALSVTGALSLSNVLAADGRTPVCAPAGNVTAVLGRGAPVPASVYCAVERKVTVATGGTHVAEVQGRAGAAPRVASDTPRVAQSGGAQERAVELILGRAGAAPRATRHAGEALATPTTK